MSDNNRIQQTTITPTTTRQTPDQDFGKVLQKTVNAGIDVAVKLASPIVGPSVASAAGNVVGAVTGYGEAVAAKTSHSKVLGSGSGGGGGAPAASAAQGGGSAVGGGDQWDMLEAQRLMNSENQKFNLAYLQLQDAMQKESREFNAISNIMKVRHDSAKAAINNIR